MTSANWGYRLAVAASLALIVLWLVWVIVWVPLRPEARPPVLTASTLPLLLNLRGLVHDRPRSYQWLGLLSLGYFIHGISATIPAPDRAPAIVEIALSLTLFGACLLRLRKP